jgi:hypothetical protein
MPPSRGHGTGKAVNGAGLEIIGKMSKKSGDPLGLVGSNPTICAFSFSLSPPVEQN